MGSLVFSFVLSFEPTGEDAAAGFCSSSVSDTHGASGDIVRNGG